MSAPLSRPPLHRAPGALTGLYAPARPAVIVPPPYRRETAQPRRAPRPGEATWPPVIGDVDIDAPPADQTLASQLDHEPEGAL